MLCILTGAENTTVGMTDEVLANHRGYILGGGTGRRESK